MALPINIEDLISARTVESDRIEFKEGWNPDAIYRSICAFANDFDNTGGGYILVGVEEENGVAKRPVKGLAAAELAEIQRKMIGFDNLLQPTLHPKLFIESVDGRQIIVLWIPGGANRPYQVPEQITAATKRHFYYIRKFANSVKANLEEQQELIAMANQVPFDDRANTQAQVTDISMILVKNHLLKVESKLAEEIGKRTDIEILGQMALISGPNEHIYPRNVGLMMFADEPDHFFPNTQVDVVHFPNGEAEDFTDFPVIKGPLPEQIKRTLDLIKTNFIKEKVIKPRYRAESIRIWNYPLQAIEETLVNAFYHRDYQVREPIEIRINPNSIVFINQGGPDRSIQMQAFQDGRVRSRRYRNRRLGDFLKELKLTEGRATGVPTILKALKENGSPEPKFNSDDDRTYMEVEIFIHPSFIVVKQAVDVKTGDELTEIDEAVNQLIAMAPDKVRDKVRAIAGDKAGDVAVRDYRDRILKDDTTLAGDIVRAVDRDRVVNIVIDAHEFINQRLERILRFCQKPKQRKEIMEEIELVNNVKNYNAYVAPLVQMGWVGMTIPGKPTSPKQKYRTTLKGAIISEFMNYEEYGD